MLRGRIFSTWVLLVAGALLVVWARAAGQDSQPATEPQVLLVEAGPIHLGDEEVPGWPRLQGNWLEFDFYVTSPIESLTLRLQTLGLEIKAPVLLNYRKVAGLPWQAVGPGTGDGPLEWSRDVLIDLPTEILREGLNRLIITTDLRPAPKFSGDLADFLVRRVRLVGR
jgi:hypothetical protein